MRVALRLVALFIALVTTCSCGRETDQTYTERVFHHFFLEGQPYKPLAARTPEILMYKLGHGDPNIDGAAISYDLKGPCRESDYCVQAIASDSLENLLEILVVACAPPYGIGDAQADGRDVFLYLPTVDSDFKQAILEQVDGCIDLEVIEFD